jgi:geranylgeranyl diphosphate synthase type I
MSHDGEVVPVIDLGAQAQSLIVAGHDESQTAMMAEAVILVDDEDRVIGAESKLEAHRGGGKLHRAFSVLLYDMEGRLLLQRRALNKITFPGIWANSCCSHPLYTADEMELDGDLGVIRAAIRKLEQELGIPTSQVPISSFESVGRFQYLARMNDDWAEWELDHVIVIQSEVDLNINANEVHEIAWVGKDEFADWCAATRHRGEKFAPWFGGICELFIDKCWPNSNSRGVYDSCIHQLGDLSPDQASSKMESSVSGGILAALGQHRTEVEARIVEALNQDDESVLNQAMMHLIESGGKRLRATIPVIVAEAVGSFNPGLYDVGAAIEIIHNFTLVHDDIMDEDDVRRGRPAVHIAYDRATAINAGDAMLAVGFEVLAKSHDIEHSYLQDLVLTISSMVRRVAEGQQRDIGFESRDDEVSEGEYLEMIEGKTAVMFETCGRVGALLSGATPEIVEIMTNWGLAVGMCFQLMDDLIDVCSDSATLGKPSGSDLAQGKRTLMVIHALSQEDQPTKQAILAVLGKGEEASIESIGAAIAALDELGSIAHARALAESYHAKAHAYLDFLEQNPGVDTLRELTDFQLSRIS